MTQMGMWLLAVMFLASGLLLIVFLLKHRLEPLGNDVWSLRDIVQVAGVILNIVALAIAVSAIQVAVTSYKDNKEAGQKQKEELELSRRALEAVVETTQEQQTVLQEQQTVLREQQALIESNLSISKAQLDLITGQTQQEEQRLARKPLVGLLYGDSEVNSLAAPIEIRRGVDFTRVTLSVRNNGDASAEKGIVVVIADPPTVLIDRADSRVAERRSHHRFETMLADIRPYALAHDDFPLQLDLHGPIPAEFTLSFNIFGENFEAVRRKIAFRVVSE